MALLKEVSTASQQRELLKNFPLVELLLDFKATVLLAGGFPTALLSGSTAYGDIDIYLSCPEEEFESNKEQFANLLNLYEYKESYKTKWSLTYVSKEYSTTMRNPNIQVVNFLPPEKIWTPETIISRFDLINCSVVYACNEKTFYTHDSFFKKHLEEKVLEVNNPWMIYDLIKGCSQYSDSDKRWMARTQLSRVTKYTNRYALKPSPQMVSLLEKLLSIFPQLSASKDETAVEGLSDSPSENVIDISPVMNWMHQEFNNLKQLCAEWQEANVP